LEGHSVEEHTDARLQTESGRELRYQWPTLVYLAARKWGTPERLAEAVAASSESIESSGPSQQQQQPQQQVARLALQGARRRTTPTAMLDQRAMEENEQAVGRASTTVYSALAGNVLVLFGKTVAAVMTGSGAMLAECFHSVADITNQALLAIGLRRSQLAPSVEHPYGHTPELFVWAIISATGTFFLGSGLAMYHGVTALISPTELLDPHIAYGVLGLSFVVESATLVVAVKSVAAGAKAHGMTFREYVKRSIDPMSVAVMMEDGTSVAGVAIAAASIAASDVTGNPLYDALGTLAVGGLLAAAASWLIHKNLSVLVGRSMAVHRETMVIEMLRKDPVVRSVHDVKSLSVGGSSARFKAEILFNGHEIARRYLESNPSSLAFIADLDPDHATVADLNEALLLFGDGLVDHLGNEIDRLETEIRKVAPEIRHCDIEVL
jgi:zinc transporter 9